MRPRPTYMKLTSADVMHSFWVPRLAGKVDVIPNRINELWMDPAHAGFVRRDSARSSAA